MFEHVYHILLVTESVTISTNVHLECEYRRCYYRKNMPHFAYDTHSQELEFSKPMSSSVKIYFDISHQCYVILCGSDFGAGQKIDAVRLLF
jgi:hypothetical protein